MEASITVYFPRPISELHLDVSKGNLTCEAVLWKSLEYIHKKRQLTVDNGKKDAGISTYVPAFGLCIISKKEKTFLPLHYEFRPGLHHKEYRFLVRHQPPYPGEVPSSEIRLNTVVWELLILQASEDFLLKEMSLENNDGKLSKELTLDLATLALIIFNSPNNNYKEIDTTCILRRFNFFNYRKHFSPKLMRHLTNSVSFPSPHSLVDYIFYYFKFKEQISGFQSKNGLLGDLKLWFIHNLLLNLRHYFVESYDAKTKLDDGTLEKCFVQLEVIRTGRCPQLGLYFNKTCKCNLAEIVQVNVKRPEHDKDGDNEVTIKTECWRQTFCLIFKDAEVTDSFISMLQGSILLCVQTDLFLHRDFIPPSLKIKNELRSFWPMSHAEANMILFETNERKPDEERRAYLLYQEEDDLYTFTAADSRETKLYYVQWTPKGEFIIYEGDKYVNSYSCATKALQFLNQKLGKQLYPRKITRKQKVHQYSIYHPLIPNDKALEESSRRMRDLNISKTVILEKDLTPGVKLDFSDENGDLKRFQVTIQGEDRLLVELQSRDAKARDAVSKNLITMLNLAELSPDTILKFCQHACLDNLKDSFVFEYPTHGSLSSFLNENKIRLTLLYKLKICQQVIEALKVIEKSNEIYHGNIRSSNFYVFIYEKDQPIIKLGDPGMVHMYDDPQYEFNYLNQRSPWLAPERRNNPKLINTQTECYAIGTTICEVLHATDDIKKLTCVDSNADLMKVFQTGNKIPAPDLSYNENDPTAVVREVREIMAEAWKQVEMCWSNEPSERPTAPELAFKFRELTDSLKDVPFEKLIDFLRPILATGSEQTLQKPSDFNELMAKQKQHYIHPSQVIETNQELGKGHFGKVVKCELWKKKQRGNQEEEELCPIVAAKTLSSSSSSGKTEQIREMVEEINLIADLNHENIVKFLHFTMKENNLILLMEYLQVGSLLKFVKDIEVKGKNQDQKNVYLKLLLKLSLDVAKGMEYLHSRPVIHCDLAARNVLLHNDGPTLFSCVAKVGDFGLAKSMRFNQIYYRPQGKEVPLPFYWSPPEYIDSGNQSELILRPQGDVWSFGIMLWEVFTLGRKPHPDFPRDDILLTKLKSGWRLGEQHIQFNAEVYTKLIRICWDYDYSERPSFTTLKDKIQTFISSVKK